MRFMINRGLVSTVCKVSWGLWGILTSELVDVDVARAAGTAPVGGGAHSFGVGDRDRDAAC